MDVEINPDAVIGKLLDEIKEMQRRLAYQAAAIEQLQLENAALMMRQQLPAPAVPSQSLEEESHGEASA
jgi:hypothetical protein